MVESLESRQMLSAIALFDDPTYVDTEPDPPDLDTESDNLQAVLTAAGHTVTTFTGITAADFTAGLAGQEVLVFPDLEEQSLAPDLSTDAIAVIRNFIATGGGLIVTGRGTDEDGEVGGGPAAAPLTTGPAGPALLNVIFNLALEGFEDPGTSDLNAAEVGGTAFAGGPPTIPDNNATFAIDSVSIPTFATQVYKTQVIFETATVFFFSYGCGQVAFLGWDWFDSDPPNLLGQDGGWNEVLDRAVLQVVTPGPDVFDEHHGNDTASSAVELGSQPVVTLADLTIHSDTDEDFFVITAHDTGKIIVTLHSELDFGDLRFEIIDSRGNVFFTSPVDIEEDKFAFEVVGQQRYFIRVFGEDDATNCYALEIENFAAPVPTTPRLDPRDDSGRFSNDNITRDPTPRIVIPADLFEFDAEGITILSAAEAAGNNFGASVFVAIENMFTGVVTTGFADPIGGSVTLFEFTPPLPLAAGSYIVHAAVQIADRRQIFGGGGADPAIGRTQFSETFVLTIGDTAPNIIATIDMLPSSDSGISDSDDVTNKDQPAFDGEAPANSRVYLFAAKGFLLGGVLNFDTPRQVGDTIASGAISFQNPNGRWEITSEPLVDGVYLMTVLFEDIFGNFGTAQTLVDDVPAQSTLEITIDTAKPNTPVLDVLEVSESGSSLSDNVTFDNTPDVRSVSRDPLPPFPDPPADDPADHFVRYRIWDRYTDPRPGVNNVTEVLLVASAFLDATDPLADFLDTLPLLADGVHNLKLEFEDIAGNLSDDFLLTLVVDTVAPPPQTPNLLTSSDSGTFNDDNITNKDQPAFDGVGEANSKVRVFARRTGTALDILVGEGVVGSDGTDGTLDNGLGFWEVTIEPIIDGTYEIRVSFEDLAGNISALGEPLTVVIDTLDPNTPVLDLIEASDSGRHNADDVTNDNTPDVRSISQDPITPGDAASAHFVKYRIFDRFNGNPETLLIDSFFLAAPAAFLDTLPLLADGVHNLKLEFEDVAGNYSHDFLLTVTIDTIAPPVFFGLAASATDGLDPASETGVAGQPATFTDRITSITAPQFFGTAEADAIVRLFANGNQAGLTVAVPLDGNLAFPNGQWNLQTILDLNANPPFATFDGLRNMTATAEDLAGNVSQAAALDIFIDTQGPQITNVEITGSPDFDLFDVKPTQGPTPLVNSLTLDVRDLPNRVVQFLYNALAENPAAGEHLGDPAEDPGNYILRGDHNGIIAIASVQFNPDPPVAGQPATGTLVLTFVDPLPDDRYTLTVSDSVVDIAGNNLDGESNASQPLEIPQFPTGDGVPGGDFIARFTVDSRPEIGTYAAESIFVDINGNRLYDPEGVNNDFTNRDIIFTLGNGAGTGFQIHDGLIAGNFVQAGGVADGFDKFAAYGFISGAFRWLVDFDNDGVPDLNQVDPAGINGLPVAGEFDGNTNNGDEVGLFDGTTWFFDTNHDFRIDLGSALTSALRGSPIVGDFDGNGFDDLATLHVDQFQFDFAGAAVRSFNGSLDDTIDFGFPGVQELPLAADMDGDGVDDVGLWVPRRSGTVAPEESEWYFLVSNDPDGEERNTGSASTLDHRFEPVPFGADIFIRYGDEFALPIVGNFDPPITAAEPQNTWTNRSNSLDVNRDGSVAPIDALVVINQLEASGARSITGTLNATGSYVDVNGDGSISPLDALLVINHLDLASQPAALADDGGAPAAAAVDLALADAALVDEAIDDILGGPDKRKARR